MKTKRLLTSLALALSVGGATTAAQALSLSDIVVGGTLNRFEDQSREAVFDVDGQGTLNAGDVFAGFLRLDERVDPSPGTVLSTGNNYIYAAFAIEIEAIASTVTPIGSDINGNGFDDFAVSNSITWKASTVDGLKLEDILGISLPAQEVAGGAIAAIFSSTGLNQIASPNSDAAGVSGVLLDVAEIAAAGDLELVAGLADGSDDTFFSSDSFIDDLEDSVILALEGLPLNAIPGIANATTLATFQAGLSILTNVSGVQFDESVCLGKETPPNTTSPPATCDAQGVLPGTLHQVVINTGQLNSANS